MLAKDLPKVAVLVLNYNGKRHLKTCLESLRRQTYKNYDVYIADNGSTDGSVEYVQEHFSWVKVIDLKKKNLGFAKSYNEAIKRVDADFVALLNNDTKADENWLKELVNEIIGDGSIIAVGSKLLLYDYPHLINHAGAKITPIGGGIDIGLYEQDEEKYNIKRAVGAVCGAAMLVRKNLFLKVGGFDEDYFAYFEDTDFCWRAWIYGFCTVYVPSSIIYHKMGGTFGTRGNPTRLFYGERNRQVSMIKNFGLINLFNFLLISVGYFGIQAFLLAYDKNMQGLLALVKANFCFTRNLRFAFKKRNLIQRSRKFPDSLLKEKDLMASLRECLLWFVKMELKSKNLWQKS